MPIIFGTTWFFKQLKAKSKKKKYSHLLLRHGSRKVGHPSDGYHVPSEWSYSAHIYVFR